MLTTEYRPEESVQDTPLECLIGNLIDGQEELLRLLGAADNGLRPVQPRASAVIRRVTERRQLDSLIASSRREVSLLISEYSCTAPYPKALLAHIVDLLGQGVACRVLMNPGARRETDYAEWARQAQHLGGELRWTAEEFKPMILVDSKSALLLDGIGSPCSLLITEPTVLTLLTRVFGSIWTRAEHAADPAPTSQRSSDTTASTRDFIIDMLLAGNPDKTIARRLGISLRSVQAHVATLRTELGANTRAQLGYMLASQARPVMRT